MIAFMIKKLSPERLQAEKYLQADKVFEALEIFNQLVSKNPSDLQAWGGVGMVMVRTLQHEQATETFKFILSLDPKNALAHYGLSMSLLAMGQKKEACEAADQACLYAPHDWIVQRGRAITHAAAGAKPDKILERFCDWGRRFADPLTQQSTPFAKLTLQQKKPLRKLNIGYVSGDLRNHSVAFFIEPILKHHNSENVEVFVYSTGPRDAVTERLNSYVSNWFDVHSLSDQSLHKLIRSHHIDVLIDLSGHTVHNRMKVFAMQAARVQCTWLGYHYPLGMKAIEYRLVDPTLSPPSTQKFYNERLFYLECAGTYTPPSDIAISLEPPVIKHGHPTLISLNSSTKVTDTMLLLWRRILESRADLQLILMTNEIDQEKAHAHMHPRLEKLGLPQDRVFVCRRLPLAEFMELGSMADIQLDTSPISGGTTTFHALWMGLPVVCLEGDDATANSTYGILKHFGFDDLITYNEDAYVTKVLELANDIEGLTAHRNRVRKQMQQNKLMQHAQRTAEMEKAYRLMWFNYLLKKTEFLDTKCDLDQVVEQYFPNN